MKKALLTLLAASLIFSGCTKKEEKNTTEVSKVILQDQMPNEGDEIAIVNTNYGTIKIMFFPEEAPKAVENFITHAKEGYYDGITFHRVIDGFMIQSGDPTGTGSGGESIWGEPFEDEYSPNLHHFRGALAMANTGREDTNGSQFFIVQSNTCLEQGIEVIKETLAENENITISGNNGESILLKDSFNDAVLEKYQRDGGAIHLEYIFGYMHTIFGQVFEGMDVVDAIAAAETDESDRPLEDVIIESIEIVEYSK